MSADEGTAYDAALARLAGYGPEFGGGLSNHGPMALEALRHLGFDDLYVAFLDDYQPQLEPEGHGSGRPATSEEWPQELRERLPGLVASAGAQAGHGLLRVAHATRALEDATSAVRRSELQAALRYWSTGAALAAPSHLTGDSTPDEVLPLLWRLSPEVRRPGLLTHNLHAASDDPRFGPLVASLGRAGGARAVAARFDELALVAASGVVANTGIDQFALLHGVTTSTMARTLLPYLDTDAVARLEAAVTGFVLAAVIGFDSSASRGGPQPADGLGDPDRSIGILAREAAESLGDHHIKLADACVGLTERTGSTVPGQALAAFTAV